MWLKIILTLLIFFVFKILSWIYKRQKYFEENGIPYFKSTPLLGVLKDNIGRKKDTFACFDEVYNDPVLKNEPFCGMFMFHKPTLMIKNPELIKRIMITDFNQFSNRSMDSDIHDPIGYYNVLMAKNPLWKFLRAKLSPFFTPSKIKSYFHLIDNVSFEMTKYLEDQTVDGVAKVRAEFLSKSFTMDVISSVFFGVDINSFRNFHGELQSFVHNSGKRSIKRIFETLLIYLVPEYSKLFNATLFGKNFNDFFLKFIPDVMSKRETFRNDLIDLLKQLKKDEKMSDEILVAQAVVFFTAGFETTANAMVITLFELAKQPKLQEKLINEVRATLADNDNQITFDVLMKMPFLNKVVKETQRKYAAATHTDRVCTNPDGYSLEPYSDFKIPYGMSVFIPIYAIGRDSKYFEDPLKYDPDRADAKSFEELTSLSDFSFGAGPRTCLGEKIANVELRRFFVEIFRNYRVETCAETVDKFVLSKKGFLLKSDEPIVLNFVREK